MDYNSFQVHIEHLLRYMLEHKISLNKIENIEFLELFPECKVIELNYFKNKLQRNPKYLEIKKHASKLLMGQ